MTLVLAAIAGCTRAPEPPAGDTAAPPGIDAAAYERLFRERFCDEWDVCAAGAPCPYDDQTPVLPDRCGYDPNAAQACVVGTWECVIGSAYPTGPDACAEVCSGTGSTTFTSF
jgi:hypothetical protein